MCNVQCFRSDGNKDYKERRKYRSKIIAYRLQIKKTNAIPETKILLLPLGEPNEKNKNKKQKKFLERLKLRYYGNNNSVKV